MISANLHTKAADLFGANASIFPPTAERDHPFVSFSLATVAERYGGCTGSVSVMVHDPAILDKIAAAATQAAADLRTLIHRAEAKALRKPDPDAVIGQGGEIVPDLADHVSMPVTEADVERAIESVLLGENGDSVTDAQAAVLVGTDAATVTRVRNRIVANYVLKGEVPPEAEQEFVGFAEANALLDITSRAEEEAIFGRDISDPSITPTLDEALHDPAGFVAGMTEVHARR